MDKQRATILIVDDEARNRALLRGYLGASYELIEAADGAAALAAVETRDVDLVLLDVMMPGQDGFDTCRMIKAVPRDLYLPVVLVTALGEQDDRNRGLEAGADDFLHKPLDRKELVLRVRNFLRLRQQERVIRDQIGELRRLQSMKDDLVSLLVHDLRNPLSGVMSSIELAAEKPASPDQAEDLARALKAATGMREVLDETLHVRLLEENALIARRAPADITAVVQGAITTLEATARRRNISLRTVFDGERDVAVDEKLLRRSIENLLSNAIKYTPRSSDIEVRVSNHSGFVDIQVGDRGPGIPDALKSTMFEKFGSLEAKKGASRRGVGLGLYLVRLVAEAHGGDVSVGDREGGGALLRLRLAPDLAGAAVEGAA